MEIDIVLDTECNCTYGMCDMMWGEDDRGDCVNRLKGDVRVKFCYHCGSGRWHHNGACIPCTHLGV